jgi:uncharacterized protein YukE|tara:strand:+ start:329 stop:691 length:363 start_codon:yes stop_codon:yes gene_type:complete
MRSEKFTITGIANAETASSVIFQSTESERKRLKGVYLTVSAYQANQVKIYKNQEAIQDLYDYLLDTHEQDATAAYYPSTNKMHFIPMDEEAPVGTQFKVTLVCGGNLTTLYGAWVYESNA